jgi:sarcosine oxidase subunit delta
MQRFPCPFCGLRDETEFHFAAEAGKVRPEPAPEVSDDAWADYLYMNDAPRGTAREVWVHLTCGEFFVMTRDTVTREVAGAEALPGRGA